MPGRGRMGGEQAPAEAVDRRHPGALGLAPGAVEPRRLVGLAALAGVGRPAGELAADPGPQLGRGALGEREREQRVDPGAVELDRVAVAADEDPRLAGAGAGLAEDVAVAGVDRGLLLGRRCVALAASAAAAVLALP